MAPDCMQAMVVSLMTWRGAIGSVDSQVWEAIKTAMSVVVSVNGICVLIIAIVITVALERALRPLMTRRK